MNGTALLNGWNELQRGIDECTDCKKLGSGLIVHCENPPARPPSPKGRELLFISEAPTQDGGFWAPPPVRDDLRQKLFSILRGGNIPLPEPHTDGSLDAFTRLGFFLIQTIKWPLCDSARNLRPTERQLIEHSVVSHINPEIAMIRPSAFIPLGRAACYACGFIFGTRGFAFDRGTKLEDVRGKRFKVEVYHDKEILLLHPTGLPVKRRAKDLPQIAKEIRDVLPNHWDPIRNRVRLFDQNSTQTR